MLYAGSVAMERIFGITALMGGNRFMATTVMCVALGIIAVSMHLRRPEGRSVSDSLNGIIFIIGAVILIPVLAFIALGDGSSRRHPSFRYLLSGAPECDPACNAQPLYIPWR
ncbi:MAG: hypothetical protein ACLVB4_07855 [Butyricicoccus sp.]